MLSLRLNEQIEVRPDLTATVTGHGEHSSNQ
jgi:hypothetical protein